jgi:hypothetical protein
LTVNFYVSQGPGPAGRVVSATGSPSSYIIESPGALSSDTPEEIRAPTSTSGAALDHFTESLAVTVAFDLPSGTVDVDASGTLTLPHCPADIQPGANSIVQHCDRSVDAYLVYNPGYEAGPATITFSGRGYTGVGQYAYVSKAVTVSPGQTAHAFFDADHGYQIDVSENGTGLGFADAWFPNVPDGCPYLPPPGSPASLASTPTPPAPQPTGATGSQPGHGVNPVTAGQPGGSTVVGPGRLSTPGTAVSPQASAPSDEGSAHPSTGVDAVPQTPSRTVAATTRSAEIPWLAAGSTAIVAVLIATIIVLALRRRTARLNRVDSE